MTHEFEQENKGAQDASRPDGAHDAAHEYGTYRTLSQPADAVSGATAELLDVRPAGKPANGQSSSTAFTVIAVVAIVVLVMAIVATQWGILQ